MRIRYLPILTLSLGVILSSCAQNSAPVSPVVVSESNLPDGVKVSSEGVVRVIENYGYRPCKSLDGQLAEIARNLGCNAVVSVRYARSLTPVCWSAPIAVGQAVKFEDPKQLARLPGRVFATQHRMVPRITFSLFPPIKMFKTYSYTEQ